MGEQNISWWCPNSFACAFSDHQARRHFPPSGKRQERYNGCIDEVAQRRDEPVLASVIAQVTNAQT
jgi:hypothetical protein